VNTDATRLNKLVGYMSTTYIHDSYASGGAVVDRLHGKKNANDSFFAGVNDHVTGSQG
jgi:hypothetical protein